MTAMDFSRPRRVRRPMPPVARLSSWGVAFCFLQLLILRPLAPVSCSSFLGFAPRPILRLALFTLLSFHFFALLPEYHLLKPQQRNLLLRQHAHQVEEGSQDPADHSLILLIQIALLDFVDQGLDFGRIDFGYLVIGFSHSYHTSILRGTITGRFFSMCGAELSRLILFSPVPEVTRHCRRDTLFH